MESFCGCTESIGEFGSKWALKELTWCVTNYVQQVRDQQAQLMNLMFDDLSTRVCGLKFRSVTNPTQANLIYGTGRGSRAKFDGPRGVLAYAYLPPTSSFRGQLNLFFDMDEAWSAKKPEHSVATNEGIRFFNVCYHETLHSLGLDHTNVAAQLMNPTYDAHIAIPKDHDIDRLRALYGAPEASQPPISSAAEKASRIEIEIDGIMRKGVIKWD